MEDRDGKKPFIIPKTHTSTKDVVISEKPDSRNVTDLFDDIKNCAFEAQFDFRPNGCKSCDTIRNLKLQKLYNEKRIKMKKDQDPIERLAFHLITYRDVALNVANEGLCCEQLSFPIDKYLGNPKDGVHLSKRPDVLLTSSGAQGLYRFGLLVCKVLLGKGYATLPSTNNHQLPAQLHYDHHFCKIQSINKEQRHIDDLLANSLIFCYEHENFETLSHPPQILPIAILWYDLTEKFAPELISTTTIKPISNQESQRRSGKTTKNQTTIKPKTFNPPTKPTSSPAKKPPISQSGSWEEPTQETTTSEPTQTSNTTELPTTKYPSHFMVPYHRVYSAPPLFISTNAEDQQINPTQPMSNSRDPRLLRTKRETTHSSSETIPLSPQHLLHERSLSDSSSSTKLLKSSSDEPVLITKSTTSIYIPLNSSTSLIDPRLKTIKSTRNIFYLELHAVQHALQQQKRLNHYYDSKSCLPLKTSYTLVPYLIREVSNDEYERILHDNNKTYKFSKHSSGIHYSSLYVSVVDCLNFGLVKSTADNQNYFDLEQNENRLAYEQIEISNELIQREKQLNSQQIRLRLREKRQRRIQQQINERKNVKSSLTSPSSSTSISVYSSKSYITTGRKFLKDYQAPMILPNTHVSTDFLEFFSREYKNENRSHVRHLLAELVGVFIEKYHLNDNEMLENHNENGEVNHSLVKESVVDDQTINSVIDMDLDSPSPQGLCDHDERFRAPSPPPLSSSLLLPLSAVPMTNATVYMQPPISTTLIQTLSNEPTKIFNDPNYTDRCHKLLEQLEQYRQKEMTLSKLSVTTKSEAVIPSEETLLKSCLGQLRSSSRENSPTDHNNSLIVSAVSPHEEDLLLPLIQNSTTSIPEDSSRSRDEFVKLLTKEAYISKSSSPVKDQNKPKRSYNHDNQRRQSHDENKNKQSLLAACSNSHRRYSRSVNNKTRCVKPIEKKLSSTRTVTLVSNRATVSTDNQEEKQHPDRSIDSRNDSHEEPAVKRIKIDCLPPPSNTTKEVDHISETNPNDSNRKSLVTAPVVNDDHDYRRDLNKKRRTVSNTNSVVSSTDITKTKSSRSRSRSKSKDQNQRRRQSSTNSHSSSMKSSQTSSESNKKPKTHSQPFRSPSNDDNHHRSRQKQNHNDHRPERKQSFDLANRHHKQYSNQLVGRHEKSYRNSTSSVYHQRNTNDLIPPSNVHHLPQHQQQQLVRHKRFNYNHQSVADHPRFANTSTLPSSAPVLDFNYATPPIQHHRVPSVTTGDRNSHSSYHKNRYLDRNESTKNDYADRVDSKSSHAIERLQILLENKTNDSCEQLSMDYAVNKTVKYSSSSTNKDNSQRILSRSHSSKTKTDTIMQNNNNNPTFTFNDTEKLLNMIQRSRNS